MAALRLAMRKTPASSLLLNRLISRVRTQITPKPPFSQATYFTSSNESVTVYSDPDGNSSAIERVSLNLGTSNAYISSPRMGNPFQISGPQYWYDVKRLDEGLFVRIDMPGIAKEDINVTSEYGNLRITGEGRKEHPLESVGREFGCFIQFPDSVFRESGMTHELKNGVLRVLIPNKYR